MDSLHRMLRTIRGEKKSQPDHLTVFREFLGHLDRLNRRRPPPRSPRTKARAGSRTKRAGKRSGKG